MFRMLATHGSKYALAAAAIGSLAAPAFAVARDAAPYYRAELAAPIADGNVVAGGMLWKCAGSECTAGKDNSRPVIVCKRLAGETAAVARFVVAGKEMSAEDLARCNN